MAGGGEGGAGDGELIGFDQYVVGFESALREDADLSGSERSEGGRKDPGGGEGKRAGQLENAPAGFMSGRDRHLSDRTKDGELGASAGDGAENGGAGPRGNRFVRRQPANRIFAGQQP